MTILKKFSYTTFKKETDILLPKSRFSPFTISKKDIIIQDKKLMIKSSKSFASLSSDHALSKLESIRNNLKKESVAISCPESALIIWKLIEEATTTGGPEHVISNQGHYPIVDYKSQSDLTIEFIELSKGGLLMAPPAMRWVLLWRSLIKTRYLKKTIKIFYPGNKGKGKGGTNKKWPDTVRAEIFARVHLKIINNKNIKLNRASQIVAKEMRLKNKDVVSRIYNEQLQFHKLHFTDAIIDKAVKASFK